MPPRTVRPRPKRQRAPIKSSPFRQAVWKIVDGAVRDALWEHPEYLASSAREAVVRRSLNKRIVGALSGFVGEKRFPRTLPAEGPIRTE